VKRNTGVDWPQVRTSNGFVLRRTGGDNIVFGETDPPIAYCCKVERVVLNALAKQMRAA
jgi:hypothetical protein